MQQEEKEGPESHPTTERPHEERPLPSDRKDVPLSEPPDTRDGVLISPDKWENPWDKPSDSRSSNDD